MPLRQAYFAAVRAGDPRAAAEAAIGLVELGGPGDEQWREHAQAQLDAAGRPAPLVQRLARALRPDAD